MIHRIFRIHAMDSTLFQDNPKDVVNPGFTIPAMRAFFPSHRTRKNAAPAATTPMVNAANLR
jgi:hypothetical protein